MTFDDFYRGDEPYFGVDPSPWLTDIIAGIGRPSGARCLDLGCGHGRNAIYMARCGFEVTAVDSSPAAAGFLRSRACDDGLSVQVICDDILNCSISREKFDFILAFTVLGSVESVHIEHLAGNLIGSLNRNGILVLEEFSPLDPGAGGAENASEFADLVMNYFSTKHIMRLFNGMKHLSIKELGITDVTHGPPHRHHLIRYAGRKQ